MKSIRFSHVLAMVLAVLFFASCDKKVDLERTPALIPLPQSVEWGDSTAYSFGKSAQIVAPEGTPELWIEQINDALSQKNMPKLEMGTKGNGGIVLRLVQEEMPEGAYRLTSREGDGVLIEAATQEGLGYGVQTFRQLVTQNGMPEVQIVDAPRMSYRGVMLDVSRHYMSVEFIKELLDEMQRLKLNRFHWHLVDAGGWRLEIKSHPELTRKTAFRTESDWGKWWIGKDRQYVDEGKGGYGGYYTQEEAREIVEYAASRGIVVIPEIEMPGHSEEVLYAYPQLSCSGEAQPHESDFCVGNPETYTFLQGVLDEVMAIFPSQYIHIGGDEAGKKAWADCPKCQALMKEKGMTHVDELQSHLIHEIEIYLNEKGRSIIGWDEILEGGLAPNATVMSWRGEEGGIQAAKAGHQVIMTPNSHLYFDYYQEDPTKAERKAIGGYIPLEKVYSYDPVPAVLSDQEKEYVVGVQANLWTEYVLDESHAEYMLFPRVLALAEVAWTAPERKEWEDFRKRANRHITILQGRGVNTFTLSNQLIVNSEIDYDAEAIYLSMKAERFPHEIRYRLDGDFVTSDDTLYIEGDRIEVRDSATLVAGLFENGLLIGEPTRFRVDYHKGIGKEVLWQSELGGGYRAGGVEKALLDGLRGSITYMDGRWLGNVASQSTVGVIDMGEPTQLNHIFTKCMHDIDPWVHMPEWVELSVSQDGETYEVVDRVRSKTDQADTRLRFETFHFYPDTTAQFIRIEYFVPQPGKFLFTDEIVIW